jgi:predicted dinucleotide-binding enzyme
VSSPVAIVGGSGALGFGRARETAGKLAERLPEGRFDGEGNGPAAVLAEVVVLCVPFRNQVETLVNLKEHLREGQLLIDTTVPLAAAVSGTATRTVGVWQGSAAQQAAELIHRIPGLRCVDCGRLEQSRITESLTALSIGINVRYKTRSGVRITGLPDELWPA